MEVVSFACNSRCLFFVQHGICSLDFQNIEQTFEVTIHTRHVYHAMISTKVSDFLVLTAYAAAKEGQVLTANFLSDSSPTVLQPNVEVLLPEYI